MKTGAVAAAVAGLAAVGIAAGVVVAKDDDKPRRDDAAVTTAIEAEPDDDGGATTTAPSAAPDPCDLLTPADIEAVVGPPFDPPGGSEPTADGQVSCSWVQTGPDAVGKGIVTVTVAAEGFPLALADFGFEPSTVAGADEAVVLGDNPENSQLWMLVGDLGLVVVLGSGAAVDFPAITPGMMIGLAERVVERL